MFARLRADRLHREALAAKEAGDEDGALALCRKVVELDPQHSRALYNIGLIHKYRRAWAESFEFNRRAFELNPSDEATCWNLGIAATALCDWVTARRAWAAAGIIFGAGDGPIVDDFGVSCVRLNPDDGGEVVWVRRIDPVRARILNVPLPGSGFFYGDVMLHDGAPTGTKIWDDQEYSIFNAFERVERSGHGTARVTLAAPSQDDVLRLAQLSDEHGLAVEDWTTVSYVCKACSEGVTHVGEDHEPVWNPDRDIGIGVHDEAALHDVLAEWSAAGPGRGAEVIELIR